MVAYRLLICLPKYLCQLGVGVQEQMKCFSLNDINLCLGGLYAGMKNIQDNFIGFPLHYRCTRSINQWLLVCPTLLEGFKIHSICCYTRWSNRNCFSVQKSKSSCISKKTHQNVLSKRCITSNQHSCSKPSLKSEVLIRKLWRTDGLPGEI